MGARKLPPYPELRTLIIEQGMAYGDVADKYGTTQGTVYETFRRDHLRLGLKWPVLSKLQVDRLRHKGFRESSIDATMVRETLRDAYRDAQRQYKTLIGEVVLVSGYRVTQPPNHQQPSYHRDSQCHRLIYPASMRTEVAKRLRYRPCVNCCQLSITRWSQGFPFSMQYITRLLSHKDDPKVRRISKIVAVQLLQIVGEEPHQSLLEWKPRNKSRRKSWSRKLQTLTTEEVSSAWQDARNTGLEPVDLDQISA